MAYALGRYSQGISVAKALAQGLGAKVKAALETTIKLAPKHADAHIALGAFHAEVIDKVGSLLGKTQGASKATGLAMYQQALKLTPASAIAMVEYANGLVMLEGDKRMERRREALRRRRGLHAGRRDGAAGRGDGQGRTGRLSAGSAMMWMAFVLASLVLAVTPGPGVLYIVTRTLAQGRAAGLASVAGVALGNLGNALAASLGLAALFALSSLAFAVVKWAGAAYLVWLGVRALRQPPAAAAAAAPAFEPPRLARIVRDGFVVALLNPKTALFFAAFLPQFLARRFGGQLPHGRARRAVRGGGRR